MNPIPPLRDTAGDLVVFVAYLTLPLGRVEGRIRFEIPVPQTDVCGRDSRPQLLRGALYCRLGPDSLSDLALELQDLLLQLVDQNFVVQPVVDGLVVGGRRQRGEMPAGMLFEHLGNLGDEDVVADRLDDESCSPELLGKRLVLRAGVRRRVEDERNVSEIRVALAHATKGETVHLRHQDVGDDDRRALASCVLERFDAARGLQKGVTGCRQNSPQQVPVPIVIVDDQSSLHRVYRGASPRRTPLRRRSRTGVPGARVVRAGVVAAPPPRSAPAGAPAARSTPSLRSKT